MLLALNKDSHKSLSASPYRVMHPYKYDVVWVGFPKTPAADQTVFRGYNTISSRRLNRVSIVLKQSTAVATGLRSPFPHLLAAMYGCGATGIFPRHSRPTSES